MPHPNLDLIDQFFAAYAGRDLNAVRQVLAPDPSWTFPGRNPLSGTKAGVEAVVAFFDAMGALMGQSNVKVERLVIGVNDEYVVECQRVWTNRGDGHDLDHQWCVLWRIENGRIAEGRHFAADQHAVDAFFTRLMAP